jgi:hypothetical protein
MVRVDDATFHSRDRPREKIFNGHALLEVKRKQIGSKRIEIDRRGHGASPDALFRLREEDREVVVPPPAIIRRREEAGTAHKRTARERA